MNHNHDLINSLQEGSIIKITQVVGVSALHIKIPGNGYTVAAVKAVNSELKIGGVHDLKRYHLGKCDVRHLKDVVFAVIKDRTKTLSIEEIKNANVGSFFLCKDIIYMKTNRHSLVEINSNAGAKEIEITDMWNIPGIYGITSFEMCEKD
jgi:hypothetical protein